MENLDLSLLDPADRAELESLYALEARLRRRLSRGATIREVAESTGWSPSYVSLLERTAIRKLRKHLTPWKANAK